MTIAVTHRSIAGLVPALALSVASTAAPPPPAVDVDDAARKLERLITGSRLPIDRTAPRDAEAATVGSIDVGRGPIPLHVPASYDPDTPTPLLILLHGYTNTGQDVEDWMQFAQHVDEFGFLYLYPTGTSDILGNPFWNATDACCDLFGANPDDSGYLRDVVEEMQALYNVDDRRIWFAGHSNGGFMSYRMACDHADLVAGIASLAGCTYLDETDCGPVEPVHVLQIHGTADAVINYEGGCVPLGGCHPGGPMSTLIWALYDGCELIIDDPPPPPRDIDATIPGSETTISRLVTGCDPGGSAELWTINGAPHSPELVPDFSRQVLEHLFAHPKPSLCPEDLDGDGSVGFQDLLLLLAAWGPCGGCAEDLDGDGEVGFQDLLLLLAGWGEC
jgi:polyhydroxybutyrate depolymerase